MSKLNEQALELLPCPFCGGLAKTLKYNGAIQATCAADFTECAGHDVMAPVEMWNTRAESALPSLTPPLDGEHK